MNTIGIASGNTGIGVKVSQDESVREGFCDKFVAKTRWFLPVKCYESRLR